MAEEVALSAKCRAAGFGLLAPVFFGATIAAAETTLPCRQPQLSASGPFVYSRLRDGDLPSCGAFRRRRPRAWRLRRAIDSFTGHLALGSHRGPRIVALGNTLVVTAIVGNQGGGKDGDGAGVAIGRRRPALVNAGAESTA